MNFVADESVERPVSLALERLGYEVWQVAVHASGISDPEVLVHARNRNAILITGDKDFGDLVFLAREVVLGVVLLRLSGLPLHEMVSRSVAAIQAYQDRLEGSFLVVAQRQIRIRPLPGR